MHAHAIAVLRLQRTFRTTTVMTAHGGGQNIIRMRKWLHMIAWLRMLVVANR